MKIEKLSPAKIREIAASYDLSVTGVQGTTADSVAWYVAFLLIFLIPSMLAAGIILAPFGLTVFPYFHIVTLAFFGFIVLKTLPYFVVNVPKLTGLILTNYFGGVLHVLGAGLHIKKPWQNYTQNDYIDVRAISVSQSSRFVVKGGLGPDAKGAVGVTFKWSVQYGPYMPLLALFVRTEEKAITDGFAEVVENAINESILTKSLDKILEKTTVDELQEALTHAFVGEDVNGHKVPGSLDALGNSLEERFGLRVELNTLGPPEFDHDYNQALAASVIREVIANDALGLATKLDMPKERALQMLMILNKESVNQQIFTLQADEQIAAIAPALMRALREVGDAGRGVQAARGKGTPNTPGGTR